MLEGVAVEFALFSTNSPTPTPPSTAATMASAASVLSGATSALSPGEIIDIEAASRYTITSHMMMLLITTW
jgi:hypothetical protein